MQRKWYAPPERLLHALDPITIGRFLIRRRTRVVLAWTAVLVAAAAYSYLAWTGYDEEGRPERTVGYIYIDFSGQWLMGRMLARGEGPYLYNREHLHQAIQDAYPPNPRRTETGDRQDADNVFSWLVTSPEHPNVGGALYPPIHALFFYPLGLLPPLPAYRIAQAINLLLTFASGFFAWMLTRGRIWAAVAAAAVMALPGYNGALGLAQNSPLSLALAMLGWLLVARDRPWLGGVAWGFLAFKPVWAAALFLAPLLSGRWRVCVAMLLTGAVLALATLPFVGVHAWFDWLEVGRTAAGEYRSSENWIFLSRDLQGLPRRWLHFVQGNPTNGDDPLINFLGVGLWLAVPLLTAAVAVWHWRRPAGTVGTAAAFLLLGAYLSCYHFMYYDALLAGLPLCVLFAEPARFLRPVYLRPPGPHGGWLWNPAPATLTTLFFLLPHVNDGIDYMTNNGHPNMHSWPFDTFCLLGLWAWCGWWWLFRNDE